MRRAWLFVVLGLLISFPATALVQFDAARQRQIVDYEADNIVPLRAALGYQLMVELSPDEQIKSVALGDSDAWQVDVSKLGNSFFLKPTRADQPTNLTVVTSVRTYSFDLEPLPLPLPDTPYTISFRYPSPKSQADDEEYIDVSAAIRRSSKYQVSGDQSLRPTSVSSDGRHTYIAWPRNAPIPAIYAVDESGSEVLVDGMMGTDDVYVVNGAPAQLTFRIDRAVARAKRVEGRKLR